MISRRRHGLQRENCFSSHRGNLWDAPRLTGAGPNASRRRTRAHGLPWCSRRSGGNGPDEVSANGPDMTAAAPRGTRGASLEASGSDALNPVALNSLRPRLARPRKPPNAEALNLGLSSQDEPMSSQQSIPQMSQDDAAVRPPTADAPAAPLLWSNWSHSPPNPGAARAE